jgi:hypothetical protein
LKKYVPSAILEADVIYVAVVELAAVFALVASRVRLEEHSDEIRLVSWRQINCVETSKSKYFAPAGRAF